MPSEITVLTSVYINRPERWDYLVKTVKSFQHCNLSKARVIHNLLDDRSPLHSDDLPDFCRQNGITLLGRIASEERRGFLDVFKRLVRSAQTEYLLYLEPDHHFYLPYDFITPICRLYEMVPELHEVFLRAPLVYQPFILQGSVLQTTDRTLLRRVMIDPENTGWVGSGRIHESFSFMPAIFRTQTLLDCIEGVHAEGGPGEVEWHLARSWEFRKTVGYLNGQAFCYHIGAAGKTGPGGYLQPGDHAYEAIWSKKIL